MRLAILAILITLCLWAAAGAAYAATCGSRGLGYDEALQAHREALRDDEPKALPAPVRSAAEKRAIARWGYAVGRWWDECGRYWPPVQLPECMHVIDVESDGDPYCNSRGLFQLTGYSCNVQDPSTNIRLAHKLWLARGWWAWWNFW